MPLKGRHSGEPLHQVVQERHVAQQISWVENTARARMVQFGQVDL